MIAPILSGIPIAYELFIHNKIAKGDLFGSSDDSILIDVMEDFVLPFMSAVSLGIHMAKSEKKSLEGRLTKELSESINKETETKVTLIYIASVLFSGFLVLEIIPKFFSKSFSLPSIHPSLQASFCEPPIRLMQIQGMRIARLIMDALSCFYSFTPPYELAKVGLNGCNLLQTYCWNWIKLEFTDFNYPLKSLGVKSDLEDIVEAVKTIYHLRISSRLKNDTAYLKALMDKFYDSNQHFLKNGALEVSERLKMAFLSTSGKILSLADTSECMLYETNGSLKLIFGKLSSLHKWIPLVIY